MKKWSALVLLVLLLPIATAQVFYQTDVSEETVRTNLSLKINCETECPVSRWSLNMTVPREAEVIDVRSSRGDVESYSKIGDQITVKSSTPPRESEKITINYGLNERAKQVHEGLYTRILSLPAFPREKNSGQLKGDIIHSSISSGFDLSTAEDSINFTGAGPSNIYLVLGDGYETKYYEFFGDEPKNTSISYEIPVGVLGFSTGFERLPVAVMPSSKYNETINRWSAGQYTNATLTVRDNLDDNLKPILAHETVHALNDHYFEWDTRGSWFDEGVSKYIEYLTKKGLEGESRTREVFGEDKSYITNRGGSRYKHHLPSKGDKDVLWKYYQDDREFMKHWSPESNNREFGYAYSELVIRNYIMRNGSLKELYKNIDTSIESDDKKWNVVSQHMDLTPCKYDSRDIFEECLERINEYDYPVYRAENVSNEHRSLKVERLEMEPAAHSTGKGLLNDSGEFREDSSEGSLFGMIEQFLLRLLTGI